LIRPVPTRWNSLYDAINRILDIRGTLKEIFEAAELPQLREVDIEFLEDYKTAMEPIAWALDKLQAENGFFYGYLGPTVLGTQRKLGGIIVNPNNRKYTSPLATAMKTGLEKRFPDLCTLTFANCKDEILAAITHPLFKFRWLPQDRQKEAKQMLLEEIKKFNNGAEAAAKNSPNTANDDVEDFFEFPNEPETSGQNSSNMLELEVMQYCNDVSKDLSSLHKYPIIKRMFMFYNTLLPSSAPAERLFSYSGMILSPRRNCLSDETFEKLVFLKTNKE